MEPGEDQMGNVVKEVTRMKHVHTNVPLLVVLLLSPFGVTVIGNFLGPDEAFRFARGETCK